MSEKIFVPVGEGEKIATIHHSANSSNWVFFCHGYADTKDRSIVNLAEKVSEEGFNTVVFDFRGNGESSRDFIDATLSTRIEDLNTVIDHFDPESCFVYGTSFGGKVALHAAADNLRIEAVIGKAPVTYNKIMDNFREVVETKGQFEFIEGKPIDERFFEDFDTYSFEDAVENLDIPVMILHGGADSTVHIENSFNAAQELDTDVSVHKLEGEKHSFSDRAKDYVVRNIVSWLENEF